jgi:hypothetical protein
MRQAGLPTLAMSHKINLYEHRCSSVLTGLLYTFPAYRYRSTWMSVILHSGQSVYFAFLVLGVVSGLA